MTQRDINRSDDEIDADIRRRIDELGGGRLVAELLAEGRSVVYLHRNDIVTEHPDGTREVIGRLGEEGDSSDWPGSG